MRGNLSASRLQRWLAAGVLAGAAVLALPAWGPDGLTFGRPAAAAAQANLGYGSRGPAVAELQRQLRAAGHSPGPIDSIYGPQTRAAVVRFQRGHGLRADGIAGSVTRAALNRAVTAGQASGRKDQVNRPVQKVPAADRLTWPVAGRTITSNFGPRPAPCAGCSIQHKGMDIAGRIGSPIYAAKSGRVVIANWQRGYGNVIYINHPDGSQTRYAHMNALYVRRGQAVHQGQVLGELGNTGTSSGPHLHFEIRWGGRPVDPRPYLI